MIQLEDIHKSYTVGNNSFEVLKGIDLTIDKGEFVSIMGASGSGKSTLLNILGILDNYDQGAYYLNGKLMQNLNEKQAAWYRNQMLGFVFQSFNLINFKTAIENVALPLYYQNVKRSKRNAMAMELLDRLGLKDRANHLPNELSGGQKQRVAIARSLITNPKVILADEPTGALDSTSSADVIELLKEVNRSGITVIIVTHEHEVAAATNRVIHIRDGVIGNNDFAYIGKTKEQVTVTYN
jgi:putative ABC transport system ATP-binding protein